MYLKGKANPVGMVISMEVLNHFMGMDPFENLEDPPPKKTLHKVDTIRII